MATTSRTAGGKICALWLPIMTFVALQLEHSIANMWILPFGLLCGADLMVAEIIVNNIIPVAAGNAVGGVLFVGALQWWLTLGQDHASSSSSSLSPSIPA